MAPFTITRMAFEQAYRALPAKAQNQIMKGKCQLAKQYTRDPEIAKVYDFAQSARNPQEALDRLTGANSQEEFDEVLEKIDNGEL